MRPRNFQLKWLKSTTACLLKRDVFLRRHADITNICYVMLKNSMQARANSYDNRDNEILIMN